jgi:hypothetical protein
MNLPNNEQLASFLRSILKVSGGVLLADGFRAEQFFKPALGLVFVVLTMAWSHWVHAKEPEKKP